MKDELGRKFQLENEILIKLILINTNKTDVKVLMKNHRDFMIDNRLLLESCFTEEII